MSTPAYIERLGLEPHPEGGYYRRFFTSPVSLDTPRGPRPSMTAIHYLLQGRDFSAWHRLRSSEIWHWQDGGKLRITGSIRSMDCNPRRWVRVGRLIW